MRVTRVAWTRPFASVHSSSPTRTSSACFWPPTALTICLLGTQRLYMGMSRIMTISSWPSSNTAWRTWVGSSRRPEVISSYIRATRVGVSRRPSRSRSSPMPSRSRRTPRSTLSWSKARPVGSTRRWMSTRPWPSFSPITGPRSVGRGAVLGAGDAGLVPGAAAVGADVAGRRGHDAAGRPLDHRGEDLGQLLLADGLLLHQRLDHGVGHVAVGGQDLLGLGVGLVDQPPHLLVDLEGDLLGVVLLVAEVAAQEHVLLLGAEDQGAEAVAHAVLADHLAGHLGGLLDVVGGAGGRVEEPQLLGHPAAEQHGQLVDHLAPGDQELVLDREAEGPAEGAAPGDHRHLVDRVGVGQGVPDDRVARLVVGDHALLLVGDHAGL